MGMGRLGECPVHLCKQDGDTIGPNPCLEAEDGTGSSGVPVAEPGRCLGVTGPACGLF